LSFNRLEPSAPLSFDLSPLPSNSSSDPAVILFTRLARRGRLVAIVPPDVEAIGCMSCEE